MADIAGIGGNGAFDAARAGSGQVDPRAEQANVQQAQDDQSWQQIDDQVTVDADNFGDAGQDAADDRADLSANINDTSTPGGTAAFDTNIGTTGDNTAPGAEGFGAGPQPGDVPGVDNQRLEADARNTNQVEMTESREAGNDNESQTEANRALGQVVDVFA